MATTLRFIILGDDRASSAFDKFARNVDKANGAVDRNSKALGAQSKTATAAQGGILALTGTLTGLGDAQNVASKKTSYFIKGLAALNLATGIAESSVSALIGTAAALSSALVAGGIGLGAFGLAAAGSITKVTAAMEAQKGAASGTKAAVDKYNQALKQLNKPQRELFNQLKATQATYQDWSDSLAQPVLAPLTKGLKLVGPLLKDLTPFAKAAADAIGVLVDKLGRGIKSTGFQEWLQTMLPLVKPVIVGIGTAIGNLIEGLGGVLKAFAPFSKGVVDGIVTITGKFRDWAKDLDQHSGFKALVKQWKENWPLVREGLGHLLGILKNIVGAMAGMATPANSRALWAIANPLLTLVEKLSAHPALVNTLLYLILIGKGANQISGVFAVMKGAFNSMGGALAKLTGGRLGFQTAGDTMLLASKNMQRAADTMAAASGVAGGKVGKVGKKGGFPAGAAEAGLFTGLSAGSMGAAAAAGGLAAASWIQRFASDMHKGITALIPDIARWFGGVGGGGIAGFFSGAAQNIADLFIEHFRGPLERFTAKPRQIITNWFKGAGQYLVASGKATIDGLWRGLQATWKVVVGWFKGFPGRIAGYFARAAAWLLPGGMGVMTGLANGLLKRFSGIATWFRGMPGRLNGFFRGALSWLLQAGQNVIWGLFNGLQNIWKKVTSFISSIGGWIKQHKGPIPLDRNLLVPAGEAIMKGLHVGLLGGAGGPLGFITGLASTIGGLLSGGISGLFGSPGMGVAPNGPVQRYARALLAAYGWGGQWGAFNTLVMHESGWRVDATNRSSGAYGIPQALPPGKMASAGADWRTNPFTQLRWMMGYIKARYGSPAAAWAQYYAHPGGVGWYARGTGFAAPGWAWVGEQGPELVRMRGGETVLPHGTSRMVAGYARGTHDSLAEQVRDALRIVRRRPHLPSLIHKLHQRLAHLINRIGDEKQLIRFGGLRGDRLRRARRILHHDERHRDWLRHRLHPLTRERGHVAHARGLLAARDRHLSSAIQAADRRHLPRVARQLRHRLEHNQGEVHRLSRWLNQVAAAAERRQKARDKRKAAAAAAKEARAKVVANNKAIQSYITLEGGAWSQAAKAAAEAALGMTGVGRWTGAGPVTFDRGGWLMPGATLAVNNTGRPERVGASTQVTYNINVSIPANANQATVGRQIVQAIKEFEKSSGRGWRR